MSGQGFTIFDTAVGRCGIAWGHLGILGVQLPEARELGERAARQSAFVLQSPKLIGRQHTPRSQMPSSAHVSTPKVHGAWSGRLLAADAVVGAARIQRASLRTLGQSQV